MYAVAGTDKATMAGSPRSHHGRLAAKPPHTEGQHDGAEAAPERALPEGDERALCLLERDGAEQPQLQQAEEPRKSARRR